MRGALSRESQSRSRPVTLGVGDRLINNESEAWLTAQGAPVVKKQANSLLLKGWTIALANNPNNRRSVDPCVVFKLVI